MGVIDGTWLRDGGKMTARIARDLVLLSISLAALSLGPVRARGAGPVVHFRFDETEGARILDSSGNDHHGTFRNLPEDGSHRVPGRIGGAMEFDGVDDFCELQTAPVNSRKGTVAFWFRTSANFKNPAFIYYGSPVWGANGYGEQDEMHIGFDEKDRLVFFIMGWGLLTSPNVHTDGRWHHVAATWDIHDDMVLYVDGRRDCAANHPGRDFVLSAVQQLGRPDVNERHYRGLLDDFRIYDRVLSPGEVDSLRRFVSFEAEASNGDESRGSVTIPVVLAEAHDRPVSVGYRTEGGTGAAGVDYVHAVGEVLFPPGVTRRHVDLRILTDRETDVDETVVLRLVDPTGAVTGVHPTHTYTINEAGIVSREIVDTDGDLRIDAIRFVAGGPLNDDFSGLKVLVDGRAAMGFDTGEPGDREFHALIAEGGIPGTGAGEARILSNTSLTTGGKLLTADTGPTSPEDRVPPDIAASAPVDGHECAPVTGGITVVFSEAMDHPSVEAAFSARGQGGEPVPGGFEWPAADTVVFTPAKQLPDSMSHTVTIGPEAVDLHGNVLGKARTISFTTGNGMSVDFPIRSFVSPACVEGVCWAEAGARAGIVVDGPVERASATLLSNSRFYVDIPLTSAQNDVSVRHADLEATKLRGRVEWLDTVIDADAERTVYVRRGDSLRLTVEGDYRDGDRVEVDLDHDGVTFKPDVKGVVGEALVARFPVAGEYAVRARVNGLPSGSMRVVACGVDLPERIACEVGRTHGMDIAVVPGTHAASVHLGAADGDVLSVSSKVRPGVGAHVTITPLARGTPRLVARLRPGPQMLLPAVHLGGPHGAIIAQREIDEFTITSSIKGESRGRPGGKKGKLWLKMEPRIPGMELLIELTSGGVTIYGNEIVFVSSNDLQEDGTWSAPYEQISRTIIRWRITAKPSRLGTRIEQEDVF